MDSAHLENISCCLIQHSRSQEIWRSPSVLLFSRIHHLPPPHNGLSNLRGSVCEGGADIPVCHSHCPSAAIQPEEMLAPPLWSQYSSSRLSHISSTSWKVRRVATGDRISQAKGDPIDNVVLFPVGETDASRGVLGHRILRLRFDLCEQTRMSAPPFQPYPTC